MHLIPGLFVRRVYKKTALPVLLFLFCPGLVFSQVSGGNIGPSSQNLYTDQTPPATLSGSNASGSCSSFTYTWQVSTDGVNFTNVGSGTSYQPPSNTGLAYYRRQASCSAGTGYSNVVTVNIEPHLVAGSLNQSNVTINPGSDPGQIISSQSTGGFCTASTYVYQWEQSADGVHFTDIAGTNSLTFDPGDISVTTDYRMVTQCGSDTVVSAVCIVDVAVVPGAVNPASQQLNYGDNGAQLRIAGATGGSGLYTYEWQSSSDQSFATYTVVGTGGITYTPTGLTSTTYYRVAVTSYPAAPVYSDLMTVNVYPQLQAGSITTASTSIVYGSTAPLVVSGTTGGSGSYTYQWLSNASGSFQPVGSPSSSNSFTAGPITTAVSYEVTVSSNGVNLTTARWRSP